MRPLFPSYRITVIVGELHTDVSCVHRSFIAAGDFELIPHVRSVVVLDDRDYDTPEVEEAWEHVSGIEGKAKSYAQVVSTNKA